MSSAPKYTTTTHPANPCLVHRASVPFSSLPTLGPKIPQLFSLLASTSPPTNPTGPPFFRYVAIPVGMGKDQLVSMEIGFPVPKDFDLSQIPGSDDATPKVELKTLPGGKYLENMHIGAPNTLRDATKAILQHAEKEGMEFDVRSTEAGSLVDRDEGGDGEADTQKKDYWAARLEWYESDPSVEKDMDKWRTRLSFKLKDV